MVYVTCIVGSPNKNGSCAYLIDTLIKGIDNPAAFIKKYYISDLQINYCYGCKKCYENGKCMQNDDVKNVVLDILNSDYVIIAAPSWWADVPAQLKTLFDRTTPYGDTNPNRKYKADKPIKGIAIAVRAGVREQENELILNAIAHYFGHLGIETVERISVCQTGKLNDLIVNHKAEIQQVFELGNIIGKSI
ncbi:MAG: flavodoxin family protein [Roseburia sp.]|nr:flavodoxin family protein [Roseburia sp.]